MGWEGEDKKVVIVTSPIDPNAIKSYNEDLKRLKEEIIDLKKEKETLSKEYSVKKEEIEKDLDKVIDSKKAKIKDLEAKANIINAQIQNLENIRDGIEKENEQDRLDIAEEHKKLRQQQSDVVKAIEQNTIRFLDLQHLEEEISKKQSLVAEQESIMLNIKKSLKEMEIKLNNKEALMEENGKDLLKASDDLILGNIALNNKKDELDKRETEIKDIKARIDLKEQALDKRIKEADSKYIEGINALTKSRLLQEQVADQERLNHSKEISLSIREANLKELKKTLDVREQAILAKE